ncbi:MAG: CoA-binding domain protein [Firmicutes bacterium]|nr:CoA-binding domain protein [Bacillota bacterium]
MCDNQIMLDKKIWAVVGATENPEKFGNKIYRRLKERGYEVYAVNPMYESVDGDACYSCLSELPKVPEVIDMVVSPKRALPAIEEAARLGVKYIWFQPHTYDDEVLRFAEEQGIEIVLGCVLVALP